MTLGGVVLTRRMVELSITLPDEMKTFVEGQVATGQFADASDYVRDLIRDRSLAVDRLRAAIAEGDASGISPYSIEDVIRRARERY